MAKPSFMPSLKKAEAPAVEAIVAEASVAAPVAATPAPVVEAPTVVETPVETVVAKVPKEKKAKGDRKVPNRQMTPEDTEFIVANVKNMTYTEIAETRGITKHQVNRVLMETKKQLREACNGNAEAEAAVEKHITEFLSRPEDTRPGGTGRAGVVKSSIEDIVGNIINNLQK